jgi:carbamate kinase
MIALGGNALLRRGEPITADNQRRNIKLAAQALLSIASTHELIVAHGNGPQVGLLALQSEAYKPAETYPLDILDAETEGMIGYLIEQELGNLIPAGRRCAALLTQIEVDANDSAFKQPTKPIGPVYSKDVASKLAEERGWHIALDGDAFRRVVPSPRPKRILELEIIEILLEHGVIVICAGGGGIPVVQKKDGSMLGVEAVIDKDYASALLAKDLSADAFLMLTDVDAVYQDWGKPEARGIKCISPKALRKLSFESGSMRPKVEAACDFVDDTGGIAGIGRLCDASEILAANKGTMIIQDARETSWFG